MHVVLRQPVRRKPRAHHRHQRTCLVADQGAGDRVGVHQHRPVVGQHQDVAGRNGAVHLARIVQGLQRTEQAEQQALQRGFVGRLGQAAAQREQGVAVEPGHHAADAAVAACAAQHAQQGRVGALFEQPRFGAEGEQAALEGLGMFGRAQGHAAAVGTAQGERDRQVLLDREAAFAARLAREVDDREVAVGDDAHDLAAVAHGAGGQRIGAAGCGGAGRGGGVGRHHDRGGFHGDPAGALANQCVAKPARSACTECARLSSLPVFGLPFGARSTRAACTSRRMPRR